LLSPHVLDPDIIINVNVNQPSVGSANVLTGYIARRNNLPEETNKEMYAKVERKEKRKEKIK
jgi:hypothetical protein